MSDVGLGATLQLDIAEALSRIDALAAQLAQATSDIPTSLAEPDATPITTAIDAAVAAADTSVTPDADATSVTSSIDDAVLAAETTVPVDADTTEAAASIDALGDSTSVDVPVDADTTEAAAAIDSLGEGATVDVDVLADTTAAEAAIADIGEHIPDLVVDITAETGTAKADIDAIGDAAEGAADLLGGLTTSTQGFTVANSFAEGSAAGLVETLSAMGGKTAALTIGIAGTAAVLGTLYSAGLDAVAVGQRFTNQFGALSDELENIDVGTLNGDLGDLALALGDDDEALKNAAIKVGILGKNSGAAAPEVAKTTEQILALSIGLKGANPALGEAGDIAGSLPAALARGGRALQGFGIDIGAAEIQARALKDTGKETAAELSIYEKSAAGAAIATEKYGDALGAMFERGKDDPQVKIESLKQTFDELIEDLGKPLVEPLTDFLEAIAPLGIAAGEAIGAVLLALTPMIDVLTAVVGPVANFIATIAGFDPALTGFVGGLVAAAAGIGAFVTAVTGGIAVANPVLAGFLATVGIVTAAVSLFKIGDAAKEKQEKQFTEAVKGATTALTDQAGTLDLTTTAVEKYLKESSEFAKNAGQIDQLAKLGFSLDDIARLSVSGAAGMDQLLDTLTAANQSGAAEALGITADDYEALIKSLRTTQLVLQATAKGSLDAGVANKELDGSFKVLGDRTGDYVQALKLAQTSQDAVAKSALTAKVATGDLTNEQRNAALESTRAADGSLDYSEALKKVTADQRAATEAQTNFATSFADLAARVPYLAKSYTDLTTNTGDFSTKLVLLGQSLANAATSGEDFATIAAGLGVPVDNLKTFVELTSEAFSDFATKAVEKIPTIGSAFDKARERAEAAERKLTGKDILAGLNDTLESIKAYSTNLRDILASGYSDLAGFAAQAGPDVVAAIAKSIEDKDGKTLKAIRDGLLTGIPQAYADASTAVSEAAPGFLLANGSLGDDAAALFGENYRIGDATIQQLLGATTAVTTQSPLLSALTGGLGTSATTAYQSNLKIGDITTGDITSAGRSIKAQSPLLDALTGGLGTSASGAFGAKSAPGFKQATKDSIDAVSTQVAVTGYVAENAAGTAGQKVGKSFSDGIAKGIRDNVSTIANAAAATVNKAEAAARAAADSHSPSLLFAEIGKDLADGIALGMDSASSVVDAAERIVRDAADVVRAGDLGTTGFIVAGGSAASVGTSAGVVAGSGGSAFTIEAGAISVTVEITGEISEAEARTVGAAVGDGIIEQVDRRFATDMRLIRRP